MPTRRAFLSAAGALSASGLLAACTRGEAPPPSPSTPSPAPAQPSPPPSPVTEPWRPLVHYSPPEGRLADPNGLVWYEGEWHLFHQQMGTWAHAVSTDLMHWQTLPTALEHDVLGQALTGGVVVDGANTSGLFVAGTGGLAAVYTSTDGGEAQSLATSADAGRTWQRYAGNPVLANDGRTDFRDPAVFWHEPTAAWVMSVSVGDAIEIFRSPDLITWTFASRFGDGQGTHAGVWECPDLFPLPVDGDPDRTVWVLHVSVGTNAETDGSTAQYFLGHFDGTTFARDLALEGRTDPAQWLLTDVGQDFYAARTWEHAPDGRRVWLAWMGNWDYPYAAPTSPWTNALSLPRELGLRSGPGGEVRLTQQPVAELDGLRGTPWSPDLPPDGTVDGELVLAPPDGVTAGAYEILAELEPRADATIGIRVHRGADGGGTVVAVGADRLVLDRTTGGPQDLTDPDTGADVPFARRREGTIGRVTDDAGTVSLRVVVDASSVEAFVGTGALSGTLVGFPPPDATGLSLVSDGGAGRVRSVVVHPLAPARPDPAG
ncbi:glycoside hydrolase family 32 protein [Isoptericola sp. S6320L]|uniref:glycoside hydrolase family 32 protein n=1 Tax=Isoptericola sp. S6320L TaxID=2926411 RepID=UPI001FF4B73B|nr:glycoside hydrolase family 32 protein [Isoptericola sp. S6320L]MCK0117623.1 glycoside hydrolase family 32 protein [Isoptericola sp. S6320L]